MHNNEDAIGRGDGRRKALEGRPDVHKYTDKCTMKSREKNNHSETRASRETGLQYITVKQRGVHARNRTAGERTEKHG